MITLVFHKAFDPNGGEFRRVQSLYAALGSARPSRLVEVVATPLCRPKRSLQAWRSPRVAAHSRRLILPVLLPLHSKYPRLHAAWQEFVGNLIAKLFRPNLIVAETAACWPLIRKSAKTRPMSTLIDLHGAGPEEIEYTYPQSDWRQKAFSEAERTEAEIVRSDVTLVCQSDQMILHLRRKFGQTPSRIAAFRCGVDTALFHFDVHGRKRIRSGLNIEESDPVFVYAGSLHKWQKVEAALDLFARYLARKPTARLLLLTSEQPDTLLRRIRARGLARTEVVVARVEHRGMAEYLSAADAGFLIRDDVVANRVASPTKLGEYLACGVPVITSPVALNWEVCAKAPECFFIHQTESSRPDLSALDSFLERCVNARADLAKACRSAATRYLSSELDQQSLRALLGSAATSE